MTDEDKKPDESPAEEDTPEEDAETKEE